MLLTCCVSVLVMMAMRVFAKPNPTGVVVKSISFFRMAPLCIYQDIADHKATGTMAYRNAQTFEECKQRCDSSALCLGFNFDYRNEPWSGVKCWIHDSQKMHLETRNQVDWYLRMSCFDDDCGNDRYQMNVNTRMQGGRAEPDIREPFPCAKACSESPYCFAFGFSHRQRPFQNTNCWLHEDATLLSTLIEKRGIHHYVKNQCADSPQDLTAPQTPETEVGGVNTTSNSLLDISLPSSSSTPIDMDILYDDFLPLVGNVLGWMSDPIPDAQYDDFVDLVEQLVPVLNELISELSVDSGEGVDEDGSSREDEGVVEGSGNTAVV